MFWPDGQEPAEIVPFRGLRIGRETRDWREVPDPEKLGLLRNILARSPHGDTARAVAETIGFQRITTQFRTEIEALVRRAAAP